MIFTEKMNKKTPLFKLTNRFILFCVCFSFLVFLFFLGGHWQSFLDENQRILLYVLVVTSLLLIFMLIFALSIAIINLIRFKSLLYIKYIVLYVICAVFALVLFVIANSLHYLAR